MPAPNPGLLGTKLQRLLELVDGGVAEVYADLGLAGFRPRFTPVLRTLLAGGPCPIRDLARATGVTHSAASQTVAQMVRDGLVTLAPGTDARQRIVHPTAKARAIEAALDAEWAATTAAAVALEEELAYPLSQLLDEAYAALTRRPLRQRIADIAPNLAGAEQG